MCSSVRFNVLTYATPYKQCFMQTVAELPSDKTPGKGEGYSLVRQRGGGGGETERVRGESGGDGRTEHETL